MGEYILKYLQWIYNKNNIEEIGSFSVNLKLGKIKFKNLNILIKIRYPKFRNTKVHKFYYLEIKIGQCQLRYSSVYVCLDKRFGVKGNRHQNIKVFESKNSSCMYLYIITLLTELINDSKI